MTSAVYSESARRRMPTRRLLLPLLVLLASAALAPAAHAAALSRPGYHGVQVLSIRTQHAGQIAADLDQARTLGANVVRTDVAWNLLEPREGSYDPAYVAVVDRFMAAARARGIKVLLTAAGTPCWNTTAPGTGDHCRTASERQEAERYQPRDLNAFARFAAFVAGRWGPDIAGLEVWNEPDQRNELYWKGADKVRRYAEMLKLAYPAIKGAAPDVVVLGAAIVGGNGKFLEALYKQGIKGSYDALSVHYYDLVLLSLGQIRQTRKRYGDTTPMWLGEFGWTSCLTRKRKFQDGHFCVNRKVQARNTVDVIRTLGTQHDIAAAVLYTLRDDSQYDFGLLDRNGKRKPLYSAVARAFHGSLGKATKLRMKLRRRAGGVFAVGSGPAGDAYEIDAWVGRTLRYRAVFRLDRDNRFNFRLPGALGSRHLTVLVKRYTVRGKAVVARTG